ncbi:hypothetical protein FGB62_5g414 [Gracilaria domingensis]|nr:hypothetical protein FGB62_5g414 [Gracilaria domingensis]
MSIVFVIGVERVALVPAVSGVDEAGVEERGEGHIEGIGGFQEKRSCESSNGESYGSNGEANKSGGANGERLSNGERGRLSGDSTVILCGTEMGMYQMQDPGGNVSYDEEKREHIQER